MLSKGFPEKTFCLLVIALLFVELLTPFAYAAGEEEKKSSTRLDSSGAKLARRIP